MHIWDKTDGKPLWLFTVDEFKQLPENTVLECIDGEFYIKGVDDIDLDTRANHIAFGIRDIENHPEKELFLKFKLS